MCVADTQARYRSDGDVIRVTNRYRKNDGSLQLALDQATAVGYTRSVFRLTPQTRPLD